MQCEAAPYRLDRAGLPGYELCERALAIDPDNVRALVQLAMFYGMRVSRVQSPDSAGDLERANGLVSRALEIDPGYYAAHCAKATVLEGQHRVTNGVAEAERCLALNPTYAGAYRNLALLHFFLAHPEQILEYADRGIHLSPRDPQTSTFLLMKGWAYMMLEQDEEGLVWFRRAAAASPQLPTILAGLTSGAMGLSARRQRPVHEISPAVQERAAQGRNAGTVGTSTVVSQPILRRTRYPSFPFLALLRNGGRHRVCLIVGLDRK